jgi:hypothetical protein
MSVHRDSDRLPEGSAELVMGRDVPSYSYPETVVTLSRSARPKERSGSTIRPVSDDLQSLGLIVSSFADRVGSLLAELEAARPPASAADPVVQGLRPQASRDPMVQSAGRINSESIKGQGFLRTAPGVPAADSELADLTLKIAGLEQQLDQVCQQRDESAAGLRQAQLKIQSLEAELDRRQSELSNILQGGFWTLTYPLRVVTRLASRFKRIVIHGSAPDLFDERWYVETYRDVRESGWDPFAHYLRQGVKDGRNPNPLFDTKWYLEQYPDIRVAGVNPLLHYVRYGAAEGRDPNFLFDTDWYVENNSDVRESGMNPLLHYIRIGSRDGRDPSRYFSGAYYLDKLK